MVRMPSNGAIDFDCQKFPTKCVPNSLTFFLRRIAICGGLDQRELDFIVSERSHCRNASPALVFRVIAHNSSFQSGLFASTAAHLLSTVRDVSEKEANQKHPRAVSAMMICAYGVLIFTSSATITSLILTDKLGAMPVHASKMSENDVYSRSNRQRKERTTRKSTIELLKEYGIGRNWSFLMWHCESPDTVRILILYLTGT